MSSFASEVMELERRTGFHSGLYRKWTGSFDSKRDEESDKSFGLGAFLPRNADKDCRSDVYRKPETDAGRSVDSKIIQDVLLNLSMDRYSKWDESAFKQEEEAFRNRFKSEEDCMQFIYQAKWPDGFSCPRCGHRQAYVIRSRRLPLYECRSCRHQTSLIAGTVMEGSRTSLCKWFLAFHLVANTEQGTNAVQLSSFLQVTYKTAWAILHKIRQALSQADNANPLTGVVKGGTAFHRPFRSAASVLGLYPEQRPVFVVASLDKGAVPQQVKIKTVRPEDMEDGRIYRSAGEHFIKEHVSPDALDVDIETRRYHYQRVPFLRNYLRKARAWTNRVFNGIGPKYLQHYLDEFCFRLNLQLQNVPIFDHLARACLRTSMERP